MGQISPLPPHPSSSGFLAAAPAALQLRQRPRDPTRWTRAAGSAARPTVGGIGPTRTCPCTA
eukprot:704174-Hanusia_phi.AAC.1